MRLHRNNDTHVERRPVEWADDALVAVMWDGVPARAGGGVRIHAAKARDLAAAQRGDTRRFDPRHRERQAA